MNAITWGFAAAFFWLFLAIALSSCASAAPAHLEHVKRMVDARATYKRYGGWDNRLLQAGHSGNCAAFAYTYQQELIRAGGFAIVRWCTLRDGRQHAVAVTDDGWVLDNRQRWVGQASDIGCR